MRSGVAFEEFEERADTRVDIRMPRGARQEDERRDAGEDVAGATRLRVGVGVDGGTG